MENLSTASPRIQSLRTLWARSSQSLIKTSEQPLVFGSIYELPLYNFIKISLYGDPQKWNVATDKWNEILEQYAEHSADKTMSRIFILTRQITYLRTRISIIQLIVKHLSLSRNEGLIKLLQADLGFNLKFDDLPADLEKVISRSKPDSVKLKLAESQLTELRKDDKAVTENDWDDELAQLSKFQAFKINKKETTVSEYLSIKKEFKAHIEQLIKNGK